MAKILVTDDTPSPSPTFAKPVSQLAAAALGAPRTASAPTAGQGVALDTAGRLPISAAATSITVLTADPDAPLIGQIWYRSDTSQLCIRHSSSTTKRVTLT